MLLNVCTDGGLLLLSIDKVRNL